MEEAVVHPIAEEVAPAVASVVVPAIIPKEPERGPYRHRLGYHEQVTAEEAHWNGIINPMFHHHRRRIY